MSSRMKAIEISQPGAPAVLRLCDRAIPQPQAQQILVRVAAAGVNRPDVMQRLGQYAPPAGASDLPGLEIAGEVVAVGAQVQRYQVGDQVCALVPGGGYAEYAVVDESNALPVPKGLTLLQAAALPETFFTVWVNLFQRGHLQANETLLIHGGTSGIGTTATQLAKAFGAKVITTVGSEEKRQASQKLGADLAINYRTEDFVAEVARFTDGLGANVIIDLLGGDYVPRNYQAAAVEGRILQIGLQNGPVSNFNLFPLMQKRLSHTGSTLRPRSVADKAVIAAELESKVWPLLEQQLISPQIYKVFPLAEAAAAHQLMESSQHIGKIMLAV